MVEDAHLADGITHRLCFQMMHNNTHLVLEIQYIEYTMRSSHISELDVTSVLKEKKKENDL